MTRSLESVDDQDVGVGAVRHRVADGALEQARDEPAVMGAEDDEIRLPLVGELDDGVRGISSGDDGLHSLQAELGEPRGRMVDLLTVTRGGIGRVPGPLTLREEDRRDARHDHLRVERLRELDGALEDARRDGPLLVGEEDGLHRAPPFTSMIVLCGVGDIRERWHRDCGRLLMRTLRPWATGR